jgi:pimeloyl-ACP methyl ester carboxylesterase
MIDRYRSSGRMVDLAGDEVFVLDTPAAEDTGAPPVLVVHGFPTSSIDWAGVMPALAARRRVILFDLPGFGFSAKPDRPYSIFSSADSTVRLIEALGLHQIDLVTHDMGDTVGGELLARDLEGELPVAIRRRVITNGSIYLELAQLTAGQQALWAAPDELLDPELAADAETLALALTATLAPPGGDRSHPDPDHVMAAAQAIVEADGNRLLPRLIRYLSDRRDHETRFTGAIERHPSELAIVWGDLDPIAVIDMAHRLAERRDDATLQVLEGVGHYPMIEAPEAFVAAVLAGLDPG